MLEETLEPIQGHDDNDTVPPHDAPQFAHQLSCLLGSEYLHFVRAEDAVERAVKIGNLKSTADFRVKPALFGVRDVLGIDVDAFDPLWRPRYERAPAAADIQNGLAPFEELECALVLLVA
jgi:hypothetical protein